MGGVRCQQSLKNTHTHTHIQGDSHIHSPWYTLNFKHSKMLYTVVHLWIVFCICETYFMNIYSYFVHVNLFMWIYIYISCTNYFSCMWIGLLMCASSLLRELLKRSILPPYIKIIWNKLGKQWKTTTPFHPHLHLECYHDMAVDMLQM